MDKQQTVSDIAILSTADWDTPYKTNKQHMAVSFVAAGYRVLYVETVGLRRPNLGSGKDWKRLARRLFRAVLPLRMVQDKIWVCSPIQIPLGHSHTLVQLINGWLLTAYISICRFHLNMNDFILWCYHPYASPLRFSKGMALSVYHCVDDLAQVPDIDGLSYENAETFFLNWVDHVFVTHESLKKKFLDMRQDVSFYPNVVDKAHFRKEIGSELPDDLPSSGNKIIGFHGVLSDFKVDFQLLHDLACQNPQWEFVLIGDEREGQKNKVLAGLKTLDNVHLIGFRNYSLLPRYLAHFDAAIMPLQQNGYTSAMFPMKYFEYAAALVPVVCSPCEFTSSLGHEVLVGDNADDITTLLEKALSKGQLTLEESDAIIGENVWDIRLRKMLREMGLVE